MPSPLIRKGIHRPPGWDAPLLPGGAQQRQVQEMLKGIAAEVAAMDPRVMRKMMPVLMDAKREVANGLRKWLAGGVDNDKRYTAHDHRRAMLALNESMEAVAKINPQFQEVLDDMRKETGHLATEHLKFEVARMAHVFGGPDGMALAGPQIDTAAVILGAKRELIQRHRHSAARYTGNVLRDIRHQFGVGLARGETFHQMHVRLRNLGGPKGLVSLRGTKGEPGAFIEDIPEGLFRRYRHWAERLVRTETMNAYNVQHSDGIGALNEDLDDDERAFEKCWDATLDSRICPICGPLHGVAVKADATFPGGYDHPPAHPYCRCVVIAWHPTWGNIKGESRPTKFTGKAPEIPPNVHEERRAAEVRRKQAAEAPIRAKVAARVADEKSAARDRREKTPRERPAARPAFVRPEKLSGEGRDDYRRRARVAEAAHLGIDVKELKARKKLQMAEAMLAEKARIVSELEKLKAEAARRNAMPADLRQAKQMRDRDARAQERARKEEAREALFLRNDKKRKDQISAGERAGERKRHEAEAIANTKAKIEAKRSGVPLKSNLVAESKAIRQAARERGSVEGAPPKNEGWTGHQLRKGQIVAAENLGGGINVTALAKVDLGEGVTDAVWKPSSGEDSARTNVTAGTYWRREAAASNIAHHFGVDDLVPKTVARSGITVNGKAQSGSLQQFIPGNGDPKDLKLDDLERTRAFDFATGNSDRHGGNMMYRRQPDGHSTPILIDNGLSFPKGRPDRFIQPQVVQAQLEYHGGDQSMPGKRTLKIIKELDEVAIARDMFRSGIDEVATEAAVRRIRLMKADPSAIGYKVGGNPYQQDLEWNNQAKRAQHRRDLGVKDIMQRAKYEADLAGDYPID